MFSTILHSIKEIIQSLTVFDVVDIFIISVFIYLILIWFKKAKARFMLIGMLVVGGIYFLARAFELYLTTTILQAFFTIFLFIIVVIFQDDFRHFFENIAVRGLFQRHRPRSLFGRNIDILTSAIANLSRKKIGALVVIRGRDVLERHLEAGVPLDGLLSQVLLESIFDPAVPSHDGALIIEGNRITRFGCHLPLSTDIAQIGRLGTRHTAALGIAERSDSLSIVVSEEQGTISIAEEDKLYPLSSLEQLEAALRNFYRQRFPARRRSAFFDFLAGHSLEKIIALLIAGAMWFTFSHRNENIRRDFVIPLEYRNLASERIIAEPKPKEITATFSGFERSFNLLNAKELKVSLDMSAVKDGGNEFRITKELIKAPTGLSIINIDPDAIKLMVYRMMTINVPIELKTKGRAPSGVAIRQIRVEPQELPVVISSAVAKESIRVTTEEIDLKTVTSATILTPKLIVSPEARFPADKLPEVKVIIEVEGKEPPV
ncbi:MAG: diadenylate cyclase [Candidatus Omnitrophica bacterium]|nr:diadenylate cyclase [Candidatus Omnitrophota bacterium]